ncbi:MAG: translation initiation factor IF-3 [Promethearchaeota archaeon]|jgi:translation initiation factor IF-3
MKHSNAEVLVLDEDGTNLGHMLYCDARSLAISRNLDLVQVNKNKSEVEVFKIMDHGKWKYEKKKNKQKKPHHRTKEMNFKVRIDEHDQRIKINRIKTFLEKGDDVKITVIMRGREKANPTFAHQKMDEILQSLEGLVQIHQRRSSPSSVYASVRPVPRKKDDKPIESPDKDEIPTKATKKNNTPPKKDDKLQPAFIRWQTIPGKEDDNTVPASNSGENQRFDERVRNRGNECGEENRNGNSDSQEGKKSSSATADNQRSIVV